MNKINDMYLIDFIHIFIAVMTGTGCLSINSQIFIRVSHPRRLNRVTLRDVKLSETRHACPFAHPPITHPARPRNWRAAFCR